MYIYTNRTESSHLPPTAEQQTMRLRVCLSKHRSGGFPKNRGTIFGGPNNQDYNILGSILGSSYFGKLSSKAALKTVLCAFLERPGGRPGGRGRA